MLRIAWTATPRVVDSRHALPSPCGLLLPTRSKFFPDAREVNEGGDEGMSDEATRSENAQENRWRLKQTSSWRESVLQEVDRIEEALKGLGRPEDDKVPNVIIIRQNLQRARDSARLPRRLFEELGRRARAWWTGADIERAWVSLHAAKQALIEVPSAVDARAQIPLLRSKVALYMNKQDPERLTYEKWLTDEEQPTTNLIQLRAIRAAVDRESDLLYERVRRFRNTLYGTAAAITFILFVLAFDSPSDTYLPICGPTTACPRVWQVEVVGALGGLLAAMAAMARIPSANEPFGLRISQAILKVPAGAAVALIGTMLMQSGVFGTIQVQEAPKMFAYVAIFGYSQQTVTRLIDSTAKSLLPSAD
jgi:hypothetical protein